MGFPENYLPNRECLYTIQIPSNQQVVFYFNRFDLEQSTQCRNDFIEIIELDHLGHRRLLGRYCGNNSPPRLHVHSRKLFIRFKSNGSIQKRGFRLYYNFQAATPSTPEPTPAPETRPPTPRTTTTVRRTTTEDPGS